MTREELKAAGWRLVRNGFMLMRGTPETGGQCEIEIKCEYKCESGEFNEYQYAILYVPGSCYLVGDMVPGFPVPENEYIDSAIASLGTCVMPDGRTVSEWALSSTGVPA